MYIYTRIDQATELAMWPLVSQEIKIRLDFDVSIEFGKKSCFYCGKNMKFM